MIPEGSKTPNHSGKRVRASEAAVSAVLRAMAANGIAVGKICVVGGQVEIHCGAPTKDAGSGREDGTKSWDDFDVKAWAEATRPNRTKKAKKTGLKDW